MLVTITAVMEDILEICSLPDGKFLAEKTCKQLSFAGFFIDVLLMIASAYGTIPLIN
ncbi:hypothetical protein [Syntrophobotulus glycolicus]|uniref:hypothetical protein n=1 Tax=Syntrophobotulus glycolicus TaxID=51197 RepID=UPI00031027DB|nr:hypothetical protein [Syntrophobotulus glycolicus]